MYIYTKIKGLDSRERIRDAYNFSASVLKQARLTRLNGLEPVSIYVSLNLWISSYISR